jgi:hypothetical protein
MGTLVKLFGGGDECERERATKTVGHTRCFTTVAVVSRAEQPAVVRHLRKTNSSMQTCAEGLSAGLGINRVFVCIHTISGFCGTWQPSRKNPVLGPHQADCSSINCSIIPAPKPFAHRFPQRRAAGLRPAQT